MMMDRETEQRFEAIEVQLRRLREVADDPWRNQPPTLIGGARELRPALKGPTLLPDSPGFWAWATANASAGDNKWSYTFAEIEKTGAAYANWTAKSGGRTGTMYNTVENINDDAGVQGNGVDLANLDPDGGPYSFAIQPMPNSVPVWVREVPVTGGTVEYWFAYESGVDGECD